MERLGLLGSGITGVVLFAAAACSSGREFGPTDINNEGGAGANGEGGEPAAGGGGGTAPAGGAAGMGGEGGIDGDPCVEAGCAENASCEANAGVATCRCPLGFRDTNEDGSACDDIDECETNNGGCDANIPCNNTPGAFTCGDCPPGYTGGGEAGCNDIDECATDNGGCSTNAECVNTDGSRTCSCNEGYTGDGVACAAIPLPSITSFTADYSRVCSGGKVLFSATYENGTATIDHGVGAIASGGTAESAAIPATTEFTLTVASPGVPSVTATVTVDTIAKGSFAWTKKPLIGSALSPIASKLEDGRVLLLGGDAANAQIFNPHDESFTALNFGSGVIFGALATLDASRVLLAGGYSSSATLVYNLDTNQSRSAGSMVQPGRYASGAIPLSNGKFLLAGGLAFTTGTLNALKSSELYDPDAAANGSFTAGPNMSVARWGGGIALLRKTGRVLYAGGCTANGDGTPNCSAMTASADLYDPTLGQAGAFLEAGAMAAARFAAATAVLADDKVLVAGGLSGSAIVKTAEVYDPQAANEAGVYGAFAPTGAMTVARRFASAVLLDNGKVLIAGGNAGSPNWRLNSAELYDPVTGKFTTTGVMKTDRDGHGAVPLDNGMVLIFGGQSDVDPNGSKAAEGAELYCP